MPSKDSAGELSVSMFLQVKFFACGFPFLATSNFFSSRWEDMVMLKKVVSRGGVDVGTFRLGATDSDE